MAEDLRATCPLKESSARLDAETSSSNKPGQLRDEKLTGLLKRRFTPFFI